MKRFRELPPPPSPPPSTPGGWRRRFFLPSLGEFPPPSPLCRGVLREMQVDGWDGMEGVDRHPTGREWGGGTTDCGCGSSGWNECSHHYRIFGSSAPSPQQLGGSEQLSSSVMVVVESGWKMRVVGWAVAGVIFKDAAGDQSNLKGNWQSVGEGKNGWREGGGGGETAVGRMPKKIEFMHFFSRHLSAPLV